MSSTKSCGDLEHRNWEKKMAKLKITQTDSSGQIHDRYTSKQYINGAYVGGTGGDTGQVGRQIQGQSFVAGSSSQQCFIIAQKGSHKFRVQDALTANGVCTLANTPSPVAGQMNILLTLNNITGVSVAAANVAGGATNATISWTSGLTGPVATPRVGDYINGLTGFGNISSYVQVTGVVSSTSVTVAATGNVAAASGQTVATNAYASKINNKYVWDWTSDGTPGSSSGTQTFMTSGFNPTRYRYHLATPDATFIQVQYA